MTAPPGNDERRPWQGAGSSSSVLAGGHDEGNAARGRSAPRHVLAESHIVAGRVRSRLALFVVCPCGAVHLHYGALTMTAGLRKPACGRAPYMVHTGYELQAVAS